MDDVPPDFFGWLFGRRGTPAGRRDDRLNRRRGCRACGN